MSAEAFPWANDPRLRLHAEVIERLSRVVRTDARWRWLEVGCSLGRGRGDELSDIDAGVGYTDIAPSDLDPAGLELVGAGGAVLDALAHQLPGWPSETRRFAVEYSSGVQLDLVLMPAERRVGVPEGSVAVVDKDGRLATSWRPPVADPPAPEEAREWVMLGWWAISDTAKYLSRLALYEATDRIAEARHQALRLYAVGRRIPYPSFGLVSLLDFPPFELPDSLPLTYCVPDNLAAVRSAAEATAQLLRRATTDAEAAMGTDLHTRWADTASQRLATAQPRA